MRPRFDWPAGRTGAEAGGPYGAHLRPPPDARQQADGMSPFAMAEIASRAPEAAGETLLAMRGMDLPNSKPRAYLPMMAIWSPFRNKPRL